MGSGVEDSDGVVAAGGGEEVAVRGVRKSGAAEGAERDMGLERTAVV